MYSIGIDSGSRMTKFCLLDINKKIIKDYYIEETQNDYESQINSLIEKSLIKNKIEFKDIISVTTTGYGRKNFTGSNGYSSEILCHAKGLNFLIPNIKTILDIGGQDSKIIRVDNGRVLDFIMNDKCAAGTGRFLEKIAFFLKVPIQDLGRLAAMSTKSLNISSTCVVFAESEIIGLLSQGYKKEDIISAVHNSIIHRILSMGSSIKPELPIAFVGGVANNKGMVKALQDKFKQSGLNNIYVPEIPDITGALGAALTIRKNINE